MPCFRVRTEQCRPRGRPHRGYQLGPVGQQVHRDVRIGQANHPPRLAVGSVAATLPVGSRVGQFLAHRRYELGSDSGESRENGGEVEGCLPVLPGVPGLRIETGMDLRPGSFQQTQQKGIRGDYPKARWERSSGEIGDVLGHDDLRPTLPGGGHHVPIVRVRQGNPLDQWLPADDGCVRKRQQHILDPAIHRGHGVTRIHATLEQRASHTAAHFSKYLAAPSWREEPNLGHAEKEVAETDWD